MALGEEKSEERVGEFVGRRVRATVAEAATTAATTAAAGAAAGVEELPGGDDVVLVRLHALALAVEEEGRVPARVQMLGDGEQKVLVELEEARVLVRDLPWSLSSA